MYDNETASDGDVVREGKPYDLEERTALFGEDVCVFKEGAGEPDYAASHRSAFGGRY
jgi:hypothetical protein